MFNTNHSVFTTWFMYRIILVAYIMVNFWIFVMADFKLGSFHDICAPVNGVLTFCFIISIPGGYIIAKWFV